MKETLDIFSGSESYPIIPLIVGRKMRVKSIFDGQESKVSYHGTLQQILPSISYPIILMKYPEILPSISYPHEISIEILPRSSQYIISTEISMTYPSDAHLSVEFPQADALNETAGALVPVNLTQPYMCRYVLNL